MIIYEGLKVSSVKLWGPELFYSQIMGVEYCFGDYLIFFDFQAKHTGKVFFSKLERDKI